MCLWLVSKKVGNGGWCAVGGSSRGVSRIGKQVVSVWCEEWFLKELMKGVCVKVGEGIGEGFVKVLSDDTEKLVRKS